MPDTRCRMPGHNCTDVSTEFIWHPGANIGHQMKYIFSLHLIFSMVKYEFLP
jgi:hypothetical protein